MFGARILGRSLSSLARVVNEDQNTVPLPKVPAELIEAVNELSEIRRITNPLKKRDEELAPRIRTKLGLGKFEGPNCIVMVTRVSGTLDTKAIVRDMGEAWAAKYRKEPGLRVALRHKDVPSKLRDGLIDIFSRFWGWLILLSHRRRSPR
jgi:hypothetical protein